MKITIKKIEKVEYLYNHFGINGYDEGIGYSWNEVRDLVEIEDEYACNEKYIASLLKDRFATEITEESEGNESIRLITVK